MGEEEADVVTRLRDAHLCLDEADKALRNEAADEIERLREALATIGQYGSLSTPEHLKGIARTALGQQRDNKKDKISQAADAIRKLCLD